MPGSRETSENTLMNGKGRIATPQVAKSRRALNVKTKRSLPRVVLLLATPKGARLGNLTIEMFFVGISRVRDGNHLRIMPCARADLDYLEKVRFCSHIRYWYNNYNQLGEWNQAYVCSGNFQNSRNSRSVDLEKCRFFPVFSPYISRIPGIETKTPLFPGGEKIPGIETKTPLFPGGEKERSSAAQRLIRAVTDFIQLKYTYLVYV